MICLFQHVFRYIKLYFWQGTIEYVKLLNSPEGYLTQCPYADVGKKIQHFYLPENIFLMFAAALSLEQLDRSQPNFYTWWRGGLARTVLLKMGVVSLNVSQPSWKKHCFPAPSGLILASSSCCFFLSFNLHHVRACVGA